ncbi:MAG: single-stranded DNA-binding protein [Planctomycetota bacterium]|jgi:single-strand DNA-binding protein|nr:single-stranded DNA-binding protein [Planctomycetota bacterium]
MPSFNRVILVGNLTRDPELRTTPNGKAVTDITLAINEFRGRSDAGAGGSSAVFIDVTVWERAAENVCQYMRKGNPLLVEGRLSADKWVDKETGKNMSKIRVVASSVQFLNGRGEGDGGSFSGGNHDDAYGGGNARASGRYQAPARPAASAPARNNPPDDFATGPAGGDDIPF